MKYTCVSNLNWFYQLTGTSFGSKKFGGEIKNSDISGNIYFIKTSKETFLFLNIQIQSELKDPQRLNIVNSRFENNQAIFQEYNKDAALDWFNKSKLIKGDIIDGSENQYSNISEINSILSPKIIWIQTKHINFILLSNVTFSDNNLILFIESERVVFLQISEFFCQNKYLNLSIESASCIQVKEHKSLIIHMKNSVFQNKFIRNRGIISIISSLYDKELILFNKVEQISNMNLNTLININNVTFNNIKFHIDSQFAKQSIIQIDNIQTASISITNVKFQNILSQTPSKMSYQGATAFHIMCPFSTISFTNSSFFQNYQRSHQYVINLNANSIFLEDINLDGNSYNGETKKNLFSSSWMKIQSSTGNFTNCRFQRSIAQKGAGMVIIPNIIGSNFTFSNCLFKQLISSEQGGAIYIQDNSESTRFNFIKTNFTYNIANQGGSIYSEVNNRQIKKEKFPSITLNDIYIQDLISNEKGSFISIQQTNLIIKKMNFNFTDYSNNNNDKNIIKQDLFKDYIQDNEIKFSCLISLESSTAYIKDVTIKNIEQGYYNISQIQPIFLKAQQDSIIEIVGLIANDLQISKEGLIQLKESKLTISFSEFRKIEQTFNQQVYEGITEIIVLIQSAVSLIQILNQSQLFMKDTIFQKCSCLQSNCFGSTIFIKNSFAQINNSIFDQNLSQGYGGAVCIFGTHSIQEVQNEQVSFDQCSFQSNQSEKDGGAILVFINSNENNINIKNSNITSNTAACGGGLYISGLEQKEIQKKRLQEDKKNQKQQIYLQNVIITQNQAYQIGGGIMYTVGEPTIDKLTRIFNNTSSVGYGSNLFSSPKKIELKDSSNLIIKQYEDQVGIMHYVLEQQVSGQYLPNLLFNLLDENNQVISTSYQNYKKSIPMLEVKIKEGRPNFILPQKIFNYEFNGYFNISGIKVTGTPGESVYLKLTTSSIENQILKNGISINYEVVLEIQLRSCQRGEIFVGSKSEYDNKIYYSCKLCEEGRQYFGRNYIF